MQCSVVVQCSAVVQCSSVRQCSNAVQCSAVQSYLKGSSVLGAGLWGLLEVEDKGPVITVIIQLIQLICPWFYLNRPVVSGLFNKLCQEAQ